MAFQRQNRGLAIAAGILRGINNAQVSIAQTNLAKQKLNMEKEKHDLDMKTEKAKLAYHEKYFAGPNDPQILKQKEDMKALDAKVKADYNFANIAQSNAIKQNKKKIGIGQKLLMQGAQQFAQQNGLPLSKTTRTDPITGETRVYENPKLGKEDYDNVIKRKLLAGEPLTQNDRNYYNAFGGDVYSPKGLPEDVSEPNLKDSSGEGNMQKIFGAIFGKKKGSAEDLPETEEEAMLIDKLMKKYEGRSRDEIKMALRNRKN